MAPVFADTEEHPTYDPPTLTPLGTVRSFTLGSQKDDTADQKQYYY